MKVKKKWHEGSLRGKCDEVSKGHSTASRGLGCHQVGQQGSEEQSSWGWSQTEPTRARGVSHPGETDSNHDLEAAEEVEDDERRQ